VCISRARGAGGELVGRLVAARLGFRFLDEEIVAQAAQREGLDAADVADAEQRKGWLARFFEQLGESGAPEAYAYGGFVPSGEGGLGGSDAYRELIKEAIRATAEQGDAVIVAHAASYALAGRDDVLRVLVTASAETRARRLAEEGELDEKEAQRTVKESDSARADYLARFYDVDHELPTHYDLVVSTDVLSIEAAADIIVGAAT
jgi:Cytidylate kinase-like family